MKKNYFKNILSYCSLLILLLISGQSFAQTEFITTWKTNNVGTSNSTSITIPTTGGGYSYDVDWDNDGTPDELAITGDVTHDFGVAGTYTIRITGTLPRIYFNNGGDKEKLLSVDQWGSSIAWTNMRGAFYGCSSLTVPATDAPILTGVASMRDMFRECSSFNGAIGGWDVSNITNMYGLFRNCTAFNQDISLWDVSNVTTMRDLFRGASVFNQNIGGWTVTSLSNMNNTFRDAINFNQDIGGWTVTNVTNMTALFRGASSFNQDISSWDMTNVTNMSFMFRTATAFNQNISGWDVSNTTNMSSTFRDLGLIDFDLSGWDVSNVTNMSNMFNGSSLSTVKYDAMLAGWDALTLQSGVVFHGGTSNYCASTSQYTNMTTTDTWTITDGGVLCKYVEFNSSTGDAENTATTLPVILVNGTTTSSSTITVTDLGTGTADGSDYSFTSPQTITIPAGVYDGTTSTAIAIPTLSISGDLDTEADDTIDFSLSTPVGEITIGDASGNTSTESTHTYTIQDDDPLLPAVTVNQNGGQSDPTNVDSVIFTVVFSKPIDPSSFTSGDISLAGTTGTVTSGPTDSGDNTTWNFTVSGITDGDTVTASILANIVQDPSANFNTASTSTDNTVFYELTAPDVTVNQIVSQYDPTNVNYADFDVVFSEAINSSSFSAVDILLAGTTGTVSALTNSGDNINWTFRVINIVDGETVTATIPAGGISDPAGNTNTISTSTDNIVTHTVVISDFITTWKTDNLGTSTSVQATIPTTGTGYNYNIDWGDGSSDTGQTGTITHTYASAGTYIVSINGAFPRIYFNNGGDKDKILSVEQWGTFSWTSMNRAFYGCSNIVINASDSPDLSAVTTLSQIFRNATSFNQDISGWDISNITSLTQAFRGASSFNQDLNTWDTSNVNTISHIFRNASNFNGNITGWNVSSVTNMTNAFYNATTFNQNISGWDVSSVTNMTDTFRNATLFNQNIGTWTTTALTNLDGTFYGASSFNQNIGGWNVSNVTIMTDLFRSASIFNQDISGWNVSNVTNMNNTFRDAISFNQNISSWDVSSVTSMNGTFYSATSFDQELGSWDISNVTNMTNMFRNVTLNNNNYDNTLKSWNALTLQNGVPFHGGNSKYCNGSTARANMISSDTWTFSDGGVSCVGACINDVIYESGAWTGGSNSGTPDNTDAAKGIYVKEDITISANTNCDCLIIYPGVTLSVASGIGLDVENGITLNGDIRMLGTSQLVQNHPNTSEVSGTGKLYIDQTPTASTKFRYNYMSSPVSTVGASTYTLNSVLKDGTTPLNTTNTPLDITFNGDTSGSNTTPISLSTDWIYTYIDTNGWIRPYSVAPISPSAGFTLKGPGSGTQNYTFVGTPNDGDYTSTISAGGFSLIGNPYPSALDADQFISDNLASIIGTLYFWEQQGDGGTHLTTDILAGYGVRNLGTSVAANTPVSGTSGLGAGTYTAPGQYIAVGQSFFVESAGGGTITLSNSQRDFQPLGGSNYFFRKKKNKETPVPIKVIKIGFEYGNGNGVNLHRQIAVTFKEGNSFSYENGYDSFSFDEQPTDMFFKFSGDDSKYVIAGVQEFEQNIQIPLGIDIAKTGIFNFVIDETENFDSNITIQLLDKETNIIYALSDQASTVAIEKGNYNERFYITFKENQTLSTSSNIDNDKSLIYFEKKSSQIVIRQNDTSITEISLYDLLGKTIKKWNNFEVQDDLIKLNTNEISNGVYFIKLKINHEFISKKIFIEK